MAWSAPLTAVANTAFASADFNSDVRNNLLETAPGRATGAYSNGSIPVKTATNQITFRTPGQVQILTEQSTSSTSYTNLSTSGPTVTAVTGTSALVFWHTSMRNSSTGSNYMSLQITNGGTVTHSSNDDRALRHTDKSASDGENMFGMEFLFTDLTPGTNSFQAKYKVSSGTGTYRYRRIGVIPL